MKKLPEQVHKPDFLQKGQTPSATGLWGESSKGSPYKKVRTWFVLAVSAQLIALLGLASVKAYTLATGTVVTLRTVPVDPRDMFRGDYVRLNYDISTFQPAETYSAGDRVFVTLHRAEPCWQATAVSKMQKPAGPDQVCMAGKVEWIDYSSSETAAKTAWRKFSQTPRIHVNYGIEQAFVPEGTGRNLERQRHLRVLVAVDREGNSIVKQVVAE